MFFSRVAVPRDDQRGTLDAAQSGIYAASVVCRPGNVPISGAAQGELNEVVSHTGRGAGAMECVDREERQGEASSTAGQRRTGGG